MTLERVIVALGIVGICIQPTLSSAQACVGDCNADGEVTIDEIIVGVTIALGTAPVGRCVTLDADSNGQVTVDELITAVNNALSGCPGGCDLSGQWDLTVTQLQPPEPPETSSLQLMQNAAGLVQIVGFPAFRGFVFGSVLRVDYCDCAIGELLCVRGDLVIAPGCNAFSGVLDYDEFGTQIACTFQDLNLIVDSGREDVEAVRTAP